MSTDNGKAEILLSIGQDYEDLGISSKDIPAQVMMLVEEIECSMETLPELVTALPAAFEKTKASEGPEAPCIPAYADAERFLSSIPGYMQDAAKALRHLLYSFKQPANLLRLVRGRCSSLARAAEDMNAALVTLDPREPDFTALDTYMDHMTWLCGEIGEGARKVLAKNANTSS
ncbi:MAG: hypothetical protein LUD51_00245 [Clostridia bacterium]|nr:hypothetical protein [Clostridia bacterium]